MEYKDKLMMLNLKELKAFIKGYNLQMKIVMTKKKKEELIAEILKHTDYQNGKVIIKSHSIDGNVEAKPKVVKPKVVKPKKEVMKVEPKKEVMKKEVIKDQPIEVMEKRYNIPFLEYVDPNDNKEDDNLISKGRRDILDKFGDELDKTIDVNKYNNIIERIPNLDEILYKILNWLEKKQGQKDDLVTEYRTFVKKVVYNMFLKRVLDNMKLNTFDGIVISNIIGSEVLFRQFYDNNTKYSIIRTFIEEKPFIPKRELTTNLKKIDSEYIMYGQKNVF
jgi:hypothetical protein